MNKLSSHQNDLIEYLKELINIESVTPYDNGCQLQIKQFLESIGFQVTEINHTPVSNLWAVIGDSGPLITFAGHTDVVDVGIKEQWHTPPFKATVRDGVMYGRGACDMKGALCAMLFAAKRFLKEQTSTPCRLGFLITSGEEGDQFDLGTPKVMDYLNQQGIQIDYCVIGEPSSKDTLGDMVKIGRRGSLTGVVTVHGKQGHVAYPHLAKNPIHAAAKALELLATQSYDEGNDYFPPTSFQICHLQSGTGAGNVIPAELSFKFNFRYSTETTHTELKQRVESCLNENLSLPYNIQWRLNGKPFLTKEGPLTTAATDTIQKELGRKPELSTSGGTSDGRFIAPYCKQVIELGATNKTIHQVNECISLDELVALETLYYELTANLLR